MGCSSSSSAGVQDDNRTTRNRKKDTSQVIQPHTVSSFSLQNESKAAHAPPKIQPQTLSGPEGKGGLSRNMLGQSMLSRQSSRQRPGMASHMSRKKLVKSLLLMYFRNTAVANNGQAPRLDHVSFREMYCQITSIGGQRMPQAATIRHLMTFLDKKHDSSSIMEFEIVGSIMRTVEFVLLEESQTTSDTPELLLHIAKCLVKRAELMAVCLHDLFIEYADPSHSPARIDAGGMYKLLKGVLKKKNKKYKPSREETKTFMKFMDEDGDGVVSEKEFVSYMCIGMCMTKKRKKKFKKKSDMHKKLVKFLSAVCNQIEENHADIEKARNDMDEDDLSLLLSYGAG